MSAKRRRVERKEADAAAAPPASSADRRPAKVVGKWGQSTDPSPLIRKLPGSLFAQGIVAEFADADMHRAIRRTCRSFFAAARAPAVWLRAHLSRGLSPQLSAPLKHRMMKRRLAVDALHSPAEFARLRASMAEELSAIGHSGEPVMWTKLTLFLLFWKDDVHLSLQQVNWLLGDLRANHPVLCVQHDGQLTLRWPVTLTLLHVALDPFSYDEPSTFERVHGRLDVGQSPWSQFDQSGGCDVENELQRACQRFDRVTLGTFEQSWLTSAGRADLAMDQ